MGEHSKPLKPGEKRTHRTPGGAEFSIMHVANGSFVQVRHEFGVITTTPNEDEALFVYEQAIIATEAEELQEGDEVVRRGEEDGPRGKILYIIPVQNAVNGAKFCRVSFAGLAGISIDARQLRKAGPAPTYTDLLAEELAMPLWDAVRRHVPGGASRLGELIHRAQKNDAWRDSIGRAVERAEEYLGDETADRQDIATALITSIRELLKEAR